MKPHSLILIFGLILCIQQASAFGYLGTGDKRVGSPGDEVHFKTYLFGTNESVKVMKVDAPKNWSVNIDPERVNFPVEHDFRYMQTPEGYRKIVPVQFTVSIPQNQQSGDYHISVFFTNNPSKGDKDAAVAVRQVQDIQFDISVIGENNEAAEQNDVADETQGLSYREKTDSGGMLISVPKTKDVERKTPTGKTTKSLWGNPVFVLLLFEITWGIALVYVMKRRDIL